MFASIVLLLLFYLCGVAAFAASSMFTLRISKGLIMLLNHCLSFDIAFFHGQSLGFVDREGEACYDWKLCASQSRSFFRCRHRKYGDPLWLSLVEGRAAIVREVADKRLGK